MSHLTILGAGIAGLGAAYQAKKLGLSYSIYESRNRAGGLLDNFIINDFRFDNAIHLSFTTNKIVRSIFDQTDYYTHLPEPYNFYRGKWVKHPVQNNLSVFDKDEIIKNVVSIVNASKNSNQNEAVNFKEWLYSQYGEYFSNKFSIPYTRKYWAVEPEFLGVKWLGPRLRKSNIEEVLYGAFNKITPNQYYATEMRYPKIGGYKAFIDPLIREQNILFDHNVIEIDIRSKIIYFSNGKKINFERMISTLPLPKLVDICRDLPLSIREESKSLYATQIDLISVGFSKPDVAKHLWFYIYDEDILPARVYSPNLKSRDNVPEGCSSLQFEIYSSFSKKHDLSSDSLQLKIIDCISRLGIAEKSDILFMHHKKLNYGNVIFNKGMEEKRDFIKQYFALNDIDVAGRFGEWEYYWSDQSFLSGIKAVNRIYSKEK